MNCRTPKDHRRVHGARVSRLPFGEVVRIDSINLVRVNPTCLDVAVDHPSRQSQAIDEDNLRVDAGGAGGYLLGERARGDEDALARTFAVQGANGLLNLGAAHRVVPAFGLGQFTPVDVRV